MERKRDTLPRIAPAAAQAGLFVFFLVEEEGNEERPKADAKKWRCCFVDTVCIRCFE